MSTETEVDWNSIHCTHKFRSQKPRKEIKGEKKNFYETLANQMDKSAQLAHRIWLTSRMVLDSVCWLATPLQQVHERMQKQITSEVKCDKNEVQMDL